MSSTIYINGTDKTNDVVRESYNMTRDSSYRNSSLSFVLRAITTLPDEGDVVEFYDSGVLVFGGKISFISHISPLPEKAVQITCVDWYHEVMAQMVRKTYIGQTLYAIVQDIVKTRVLEQDLKLMIQFEDGTGTTALDSTQYDGDATLVGAVTWDTTNFAVDMDGASGSYISIADDADVDFRSDFSLCIELRLDALNRTILHKTNGANDPPYKVSVGATGFITFTVSTSDTDDFSIVTTTHALVTGTDYSIVCTYDQATGIGKIYIDGVERKSGSLTTSNLNNSTGALVVGATSGNSLDGKVYRISAYSRTLSALEARRWDLDMLEVKAPERLMRSAELTIEHIAFPYVYPADCLTDLCGELGLAWRIDQQMFIRVYDVTGGDVAATIDEDDGLSMLQGQTSVDVDISQVRNVVIVRGGVYSGTWQSDVLLGNGSNTVFPLPYKYADFEMFTDTAGLCGSLRSWFKMEESSGNLADQKAANTLVASNLTYSQSGKLGNALDFNGTTSTARKTAAAHGTGNYEHSMLSWVKPDLHDTTERVIMGFGDFAGGHSKLSIISVSSVFYIRHNFGDGIVNDFALTATLVGAWHLVGMTYNPTGATGKELKVYLDGAQVGSTIVLASTPDIDAGVMEIGGNNGATVFDGDIDDTSFFNYALSDQEHESYYMLANTSTVSAAILRTGTEFLDEVSGFDALYNYSEKNYKFSTAPSNGNKLYPTGQPQIPVQAIRANPASIETYGRREMEINDSTIEDIQAARQLASAQLSRLKSPVTTIGFSTYKTGIDPGDLVSIVMPSYGISSGSYLVQKVTTAFNLPILDGSIQHVYTIEAVNVPSKDWLDFMRDAFLAERRKIDPAEEQTIGDLQDYTEDIGVAEVWTIQTPIDHDEAVGVDDAHPITTVTSGGYKWSNDGGTTTNKLRWNLGDWG